MKGRLLGESPFNLERILSKFQMTPYFAGYTGQAAIGGVEMALWDLMGKATGHPVCDLLGGRYRERVEVAAYLFFRHRAADGLGGEGTVPELTEYAAEQQRRFGFRVFKYKGGVFAPQVDLEMLHSLRERFGPAAGLRIDPNGLWSATTALGVVRAMEPLNLEYCEDPVWGLEAMSRLRAEVHVPFSTNMCVVDFDTLPVGIRLKAVDVVLGDPHKWGGLLANKKLSHVCETFALGMSIHSGAELGISTAANVHLAASSPAITFAIDSHYHHMRDDILEGGLLPIEGGSMAVPTAPGLGVTLDPDRFARYRERFAKATPNFVFDPARPDWIPRRPMW
jgi:glucarate dehydratase